MNLFSTIIDFFFPNANKKSKANEEDDEQAIALSEYFRLYCLDENQKKQYVVFGRSVFADHSVYHQGVVLQLLPPDLSETNDIPLFVCALQKSQNWSYYIIATDKETQHNKYFFYCPSSEFTVADHEPIYFLNNGVKESKLSLKDVDISDGHFISRPISYSDSSCCDVFVEMEKPFVLK